VTRQELRDALLELLYRMPCEACGRPADDNWHKGSYHHPPQLGGEKGADFLADELVKLGLAVERALAGSP